MVGNYEEAPHIVAVYFLVRDCVYFAPILPLYLAHLCFDFRFLIYPEPTEALKEAYVIIFDKSVYVRFENTELAQILCRFCFLFRFRK